MDSVKAAAVSARLWGVSDQIGRHDATGALARDARGRVDPEGYVRSALQGRELLVLHGVLAAAYGLLLAVRGFGVRGGVLVLGCVVVVDILLVGGFRVGRWWAEQRRRRGGRAPSWNARLFVLQARTQGIEIPRSIRGDSRLGGRLAHTGVRWTWWPGAAGPGRRGGVDRSRRGMDAAGE